FHLATASTATQGFLRGLSYVLPNFEDFDVMGAAAHGTAVTSALILQNTLYALLYSAIVLLIAAAVFSRRNLK
ncbi:MAG: hypothetical protein WA798_08685, partial [Candidatus Acidiferrum sp.]